MCGIVGIVSKTQGVEQEQLNRMNDALTHRGPDGSGTTIFKNIGLGHRRLSFIDLEGGKQPMSDADETVTITFNGEIYNFQELREQLVSAGYEFESRSDTEVIINAYKHWGTDCIHKLRGMFAFCILDRKKEQLFIARDPVGIKPVYYFSNGDSFAFASELQALKHVPGFKPDINTSALDKYLWLQYIPAPETIFVNTHKLLPGHYMTVSFGGEITKMERYWNIKFEPDSTLTQEQWQEGLDSVLRDSVKKHLVSDVPFGAFLSGGLDSSAVVGYMAQILDQPVKTFSIGFKEEQYNETSYARQVAKKWNTEHHEEIIEPAALDILPDLVRHYGEPFGDSSALPTYYVSKLAKKHVKMVLSGDGGDEALAGYSRYWKYMHYEQVAESSGMKDWLKGMGKKVMPSKFQEQHTVQRYIGYMEFLDLNFRKKLWRPEFHNVITDNVSMFEGYYNDASKWNVINKMQYFDLHCYLPYDILTKVDVASMMNSLEVRTPMVDRTFWEFAAKIPTKMNLNKNMGDWQGKQLLKELMKKDYGHDFAYRKKMGFSVPLDVWLSAKGDFKQEMKARLLGTNSNVAEYLNPTVIESFIENNQASRVWLLLFLEEWLKAFKSDFASVNQ